MRWSLGAVLLLDCLIGGICSWIQSRRVRYKIAVFQSAFAAEEFSWDILPSCTHAVAARSCEEVKSVLR